MPITPEDRARQNIERLLESAGWLIQNRQEANITAGRRVAVREFSMRKRPGETDYLLGSASSPLFFRGQSNSFKGTLGYPAYPPESVSIRLRPDTYYILASEKIHRLHFFPWHPLRDPDGFTFRAAVSQVSRITLRGVIPTYSLDRDH